METKELRIGNYLSTNFMGFVRVTSIMDKIQYAFNKDSFWDWPEYFQPIPLTEEILLKCGFEKSGFYYWNEETTFYLKFGMINGVDCLYFKTDFAKNEWIQIDSVHKLQNIYFLITGTELAITLNPPRNI